jgi:hypothetical protein
MPDDSSSSKQVTIANFLHTRRAGIYTTPAKASVFTRLG